jgi:hypothetical protein
MAIEIPLKRKYLQGGTSRHKSKTGNNQTAKLHRQLTATEIALHAAQPCRVMLLQANGKVRMITVQPIPVVRKLKTN